MKQILSFFTFLLMCVAADAARFTVDFSSKPAGSAVTVSGSGTATVTDNPAGSGKVVRMECKAYGALPQFEVTLPEGLTLGDCTAVGLTMYIPSGGNEQYANYKQLLIDIDGTRVFKNTTGDGSDDYPKQGEKDSWMTKSVAASQLTLSASQKGLRTFTIAAGLNDDDMTYYIGELIFSYELNRPSPELPAQGAFYTGRYRNIFVEAGYSDADVERRIQQLWATYFEGDPDTERLYYESGSDMAYILDVNNNDVRTEGMSYGMMICVQLDRKAEFDRLWKWAKTYMQFPADDERRGYFAWQCNTDGSKKGNTPASDGEEYFVTALLFASGRWGDGDGIYAYGKEADYILEMSRQKPDKAINPYSSYTPLFDRTERQVVFVPYASAAKFTDPSYHLPAFYELWSRTASNDRDFYTSMAAKSREMWPKFAHPQTGLMPDYADFDGSAHQGDGDHSDFLYDAWRCMMNMAMDYAWFRPSGVDYPALVERIHRFFASKGITEYHSVYTLDGQYKNGVTDHSAGLVACNASGALASTDKLAWQFVDNFFDTGIPTGRYRYYDGCLYFLNWLNCAGRYRIWGCGAAATDGIGSVTADAGEAGGEDRLYTLGGQQVTADTPAPGLYIRVHNGKVSKEIHK